MNFEKAIELALVEKKYISCNIFIAYVFSFLEQSITMMDFPFTNVTYASSARYVSKEY